MNLEEISAHLEIHQVLYRYCRGVDRGDADLIASVYHDDAMDIHGAWSGLGVDFAPWIVEHMNDTDCVGQHHITNVLIELDGNDARVESYFFAMHPVLGADGVTRLVPTGGRYLDRFECRNGAWRIAHREVVMDWSQPGTEPERWSEQVNFPAGGRRDRDRSHGFFR